MAPPMSAAQTRSCGTRRNQDARTSNIEAGQRRCARRKGAVDTGRGIRQGRDGSYPGGQTWSAIDQAGNCHWAFEGEARRSETAGRGFGGNSEKGGAGYGGREASAQGFGEAVAGHRRRAEARRAGCSFTCFAVTADEEERRGSKQDGTSAGSEEGSGNETAAGCVVGFSSTALHAKAGSSARRRFATASVGMTELEERSLVRFLLRFTRLCFFYGLAGEHLVAHGGVVDEAGYDHGDLFQVFRLQAVVDIHV